MKNETQIRAIVEEAAKILKDYPHLKYYQAICKDMGDKDNPNDIYHKDVIALDFAIARLKKDLKKPASLN